ncbi:DUF3576 domain-containing protein [Roseobacter sp.]|uniref:DUF3576 domain-containing protein n=1 Tax=Roseobacter sp. TaxID=1907202 RepID=UPI0032981C9F
MTSPRILRLLAITLVAATLAACGARDGEDTVRAPSDPDTDRSDARLSEGAGSQTIWEAFGRRDVETNVAVNKYIWSASLEVLDFLPVQSVDPFTGVIITGFGRPPGGGRAYRATVLINDPALDARALNVSLQTQNGPASAATIRAVEDAILSRARQLRIADNRF